MPKIAPELSDKAVKALKEPGYYAVGGVSGLTLQVAPGGSKSWLLRYSVGGRRREMGLGSYRDVPLKVARERAREARLKLSDPMAPSDPIEHRRRERSALAARELRTTTFREAAEAYIAAHRASWANSKHVSQWENTLATYVYPVIGHMAVGDIEVAHVLKVLSPEWTTKTETLKRVRGRIEQVLDAAHARGQIVGAWTNPARWRGTLDKLLARPSRVAKVQHYLALPYDETPAFLARLKTVQGMGARALEFVALTAARSGEVRGALWSEIDLGARVWTIPGDRMKAGREHRVPLSQAAVDLLTALPRMAGTDFVFPASRGGALSDMTLSAVMRRMDVKAVPHGLRSTFRDWAAERTAYPSEVAEMALAHTIPNKVESAYRRGDLFEKRVRLMADWATFLSTPRPAAGATPIRAAV